MAAELIKMIIIRLILLHSCNFGDYTVPMFWGQEIQFDQIKSY